MESFGTGTKAGIRYIDNVLAHIDAALADELGGVVKSGSTVPISRFIAMH